MRLQLPAEAERTGAWTMHEAVAAPTPDEGGYVRLLEARTPERRALVFGAAEDARTADGWPVVLIASEEYADAGERSGRVDALVNVEGWVLGAQFRAETDEATLVAQARRIVEAATVELPLASSLADVWADLTLLVDEA